VIFMSDQEVGKSTPQPQAVGESSHLSNLRNKLETARLNAGLSATVFVGSILVDGLVGSSQAYDKNHNLGLNSGDTKILVGSAVVSMLSIQSLVRSSLKAINLGSEVASHSAAEATPQAQIPQVIPEQSQTH
jgi:hypothetical protein